MIVRVVFGQWQFSINKIETNVKGKNILIDTAAKVTFRMDHSYIKLGNDSCISSNSIFMNDTPILFISYDVFKNELLSFEFYYINQLGGSVKLITEGSIYKLPIYTKSYFVEIGISSRIEKGKFYDLNQILNTEKLKGECYLFILNFENFSD